MINAELRTTENHIEMRYSKPNEDFGNNPFFPVLSEQEARRMLHFENRTYIIKTMAAWLRQRKHAMPYAQTEITNMISWMDNMEKRGLTYIRHIIRNRREDLEKVAPPEKSRFFKHYQNTIIPILDFCNTQGN